MATGIQQRVRQCPLRASSLGQEESLKEGTASIKTVPKEMHGVGAGEGNKTQPSLNCFYYSNNAYNMASRKHASILASNMSADLRTIVGFVLC